MEISDISITGRNKPVVTMVGRDGDLLFIRIEFQRDDEGWVELGVPVGIRNEQGSPSLEAA